MSVYIYDTLDQISTCKFSMVMSLTFHNINLIPQAGATEWQEFSNYMAKWCQLRLFQLPYHKCSYINAHSHQPVFCRLPAGCLPDWAGWSHLQTTRAPVDARQAREWGIHHWGSKATSLKDPLESEVNSTVTPRMSFIYYNSKLQKTSWQFTI